ncbi:MAG TPA: glycerophosphoryl diester phosphodiesterase membrane domain-containing protein [Verrucomicrobiae bacterium]
MYFIIGGDTKEYGPITADDIRLWVAEGRLNAQSLAKSVGDTAWRTLASFPELADLSGTSAPATIAPPGPAAAAGIATTSTDFLNRDYELDIGGCITGGWNLLKNNFGILFGSFIVMIVISIVSGSVVNGIFSLLPTNEVVRQIVRLAAPAALALVMGPTMGGVYRVYLRASRSQPTSIGEMFSGFQNNFKNLFLGYFAVAIVIGLCLAPYYVASDAKVLPLMEQMQHSQPTDTQGLMALLTQMWSAFLSTVPLLLLCMIPVTYLSVSLQFILPLIADKQMPFWTAMKTSWKMVHKHWWQIFGLTIVIGLVSFAGVLACGIGLLFTLPIGVAAMMIAYETIFGAGKN